MNILYVHFFQKYLRNDFIYTQVSKHLTVNMFGKFSNSSEHILAFKGKSINVLMESVNITTK